MTLNTHNCQGVIYVYYYLLPITYGYYSMNYQRIHDEIIADSRLSSPIGHKHNNKISEYKEKHHIFPKCLARDKTDKLLDIPSNLIYLTPDRHFLIHKLLTKIYPDNIKLKHAFGRMFGGLSGRKNNTNWNKCIRRNYNLSKVAVSTAMIGNKRSCGRKLTDEHKQKLIAANTGHTRFLGRKHTEESKTKMSIGKMGNFGRLGMKNSKEHNKRLSEANTGRKHTDGTKKMLAKLATGNKNWLGKKHSEETKLKISISKRKLKG